MTTGQEWLVDASGCDAEALRDPAALAGLFEALIVGLQLKPVRSPLWHTFEGGGMTGVALLAESHLAVHTFPETGFAALNVYCCRPREPVDFERVLATHLRATLVSVRRLERGP